MVTEKIIQLSDFHNARVSNAVRQPNARRLARVLPFVHPRLRGHEPGTYPNPVGCCSHHAEPNLDKYRELIDQGHYTINSCELAELIVDALFEEGR